MKPTRFLFLSLFIFISVKGNSQTAPPPPDTVEVSGGIFEKVDIEAQYPGGTDEWIKFLQKNLNANTPVDNGAPAGRYTVFVQFVVDKEGNTSDVKALTKLGYGMETEVMNLIKRSGQWRPAFQNGRPVRAYRKQPVTFMVEDESFEVTTRVPYTLFSNENNEVEVDAGKVKGDELTATISEGTISKSGDSKFIIRVKKPGRVIMSIFGKKGKKIGDMSFEVVEPNAKNTPATKI